MSDQIDFRGSVPAGAMESDSEAANGLLRIAKTPSPRPARNSGAKRARGSEKSPTQEEASSNKLAKPSKNWGSVSTETGGEFHPGSSSKNNNKPISKRVQGKAPARANSSLGGRGRNSNAGIMGAKATAARKGALIPASPKGKAKKKSADADKDEDLTAEAPLADKDTTDNNMTPDKEDKTDNNGEGNEPQEDQGQEELESTSSREANTPKIDISDQTKVRHPMRQIRFAVIMILLWLHCDTRIACKNDTTFSPTRSNFNDTKQSAYRTWFELAPTQTIPNKAHVLKEQTASSLMNTCFPQVFKIETAAKDRPRA
eukprot:6204620-Pleurochrysis_carterae.AAC.1